MKIDPEAQHVLDSIAAQRAKAPKPDHSPTTSERVSAVRSAYAGAAQLSGTPEPVTSVEDRTVDGPNGPIPIRIYRAATSAAATPALIWFHGGSFISGDLDTHDAPLRAITNRSGFTTVAVAWRQAPEHPYPAGLEDAYAVVRWAASEAGHALGFDASHVIVGGDSAGGSIAAATSLLSRDRGGPVIAAQVLIYPNTDLTGDGSAYPSWKENDGLVLARSDMEANFALYAGDADRRQAGLSPIHGDLHGLPRALVITGEADPQRDEGEAYAEKLQSAGVAVDHMRYPGMIHGFLQMAGVVRAGATLIDQVGAWVADALARERSARRYHTLLVVGATGPTGREIVAQGVARGYRVRALLREADRDMSRDAGSTNLTVITGDVLDAKAMLEAVEGVDAVVSALGSKVSLLHGVTMLSEGTRSLVDAMRAKSVKRLVAITGVGAGDSRGHGGFVYDLVVRPVVLRNVYEDKDRQEEVIRRSGLDWTIVRPAQLSDDAPKHGYRVLTDLTGVTAKKIARADVAHFVLEELERGAYVGRTPLITD